MWFTVPNRSFARGQLAAILALVVAVLADGALADAPPIPPPDRPESAAPGLAPAAPAAPAAPKFAARGADDKLKSALDAASVAPPPENAIAAAEKERLRALETQIEAVARRLRPSVVGIQVGTYQGSGVIVSPDGLVLTAAHVVPKPGQKVLIRLADGRTVEGKSLGSYTSADAGMIRIEGQPPNEPADKDDEAAHAASDGVWSAAELGNGDDLTPGAWCVAMGHPLGFQSDRPPVVRVGRIIRTSEEFIQSDCPLVGGDSGGPLFDLQGRVIGVNSRIGLPIDLNYHVRIDVFRRNWERLLKGDTWEDEPPSREGAEMRAAFRGVVADARRATAEVLCDGQPTALGTIVGPDGWIVTKASELQGKVTCRLPDGRALDARTVGVSRPFDLAMLKVDAADLPAVDWQDAAANVGQWVASVGLAPDPVAIGVVSVPPRRIPPMNGMMGIVLKANEAGPAEVDKVVPSSPAEDAGLKPGDVITHLDGKATPTAPSLAEVIRQRRVGTIVRLNVRRGDRVLAMAVKLVTLETPEGEKRDAQNRSGMGISRRHDDFPLVLQHDSALRPRECGGPLVDLDGKVVGVNIARGGRTETYAVPATALRELMYDLMSGRLNPDRLADEEKQREQETISRAEEARQRAEQTLAEAKAAAEKVAAEKAAADKVAAEKAAAEEAAAERAALKEAADEKAAAEEAASQEAAAAEAAEKEATEKKAEEQAAANPEPAVGDSKPSTPNATPPTAPEPSAKEPADSPEPAVDAPKAAGAEPDRSSPAEDSDSQSAPAANSPKESGAAASAAHASDGRFAVVG